MATSLSLPDYLILPLADRTSNCLVSDIADRSDCNQTLEAIANPITALDGTTMPSKFPLPTNYRLHSDYLNPFICPVRDCRRIGPNFRSLLSHFSASHCKTTFNDNLDGTMSAVGHYYDKFTKTSPGIIVSQNPIAADASPPAVPNVTAFPAPKRTGTDDISPPETRNLRAENRSGRSNSPVVHPSPVIQAQAAETAGVQRPSTKPSEMAAPSPTQAGNDGASLHGTQLEMEDWEFAPGRVTANRPETSKSKCTSCML